MRTASWCSVTDFSPHKLPTFIQFLPNQVLTLQSCGLDIHATPQPVQNIPNDADFSTRWPLFGFNKLNLIRFPSRFGTQNFPAVDYALSILWCLFGHNYLCPGNLQGPDQQVIYGVGFPFSPLLSLLHTLSLIAAKEYKVLHLLPFETAKTKGLLEYRMPNY